MAQSNTNNFYGNVTGVQIQQGTSNSHQTQTVGYEVDYEAIEGTLEKIKTYGAIITDEFGESAGDFLNKLDEAQKLASAKNNPGRLKTLLVDLKNLAIGVAGSLIASGIAQQLSGVIG